VQRLGVRVKKRAPRGRPREKKVGGQDAMNSIRAAKKKEGRKTRAKRIGEKIRRGKNP